MHSHPLLYRSALAKRITKTVLSPNVIEQIARKLKL
jgi:hypothetical protein